MPRGSNFKNKIKSYILQVYVRLDPNVCLTGQVLHHINQVLYHIQCAKCERWTRHCVCKSLPACRARRMQVSAPFYPSVRPSFTSIHICWQKFSPNRINALGWMRSRDTKFHFLGFPPQIATCRLLYTEISQFCVYDSLERICSLSQKSYEFSKNSVAVDEGGPAFDI